MIEYRHPERSARTARAQSKDLGAALRSLVWLVTLVFPATIHAQGSVALTAIRRGFVGQWDITLTLDSVMLRDPADIRKIKYAKGSGDSTRGRLTIVDSIVSPSLQVFASTLDLRFDVLLGRAMSCYRPGDQKETGITALMTGSYQIRFTPRNGDCGFYAVVEASDDNTLVGKWAEGARQGKPAFGRITMRRARN